MENEVIKDITDKVKFGGNDDELLSLLECICGQTFESWTFLLNADKSSPVKCPGCGRKLFFEVGIRVYEIRGRLAF